MRIAITIVQLLACVFLVAVILLQSGKKQGVSSTVFGGSSDTYMNRTKSSSLDARLAKMTKWVALLFAVLTLVLNMLPTA